MVSRILSPVFTTDIYCHNTYSFDFYYNPNLFNPISLTIPGVGGDANEHRVTIFTGHRRLIKHISLCRGGSVVDPGVHVFWSKLIVDLAVTFRVLLYLR